MNFKGLTFITLIILLLASCGKDEKSLPEDIEEILIYSGWAFTKLFAEKEVEYDGDKLIGDLLEDQNFQTCEFTVFNDNYTFDIGAPDDCGVWEEEDGEWFITENELRIDGDGDRDFVLEIVCIDSTKFSGLMYNFNISRDVFEVSYEMTKVY